MNPLNTPDPQQPLRDFLRQHSPVPPPPAPDLENQLLAAIEALTPLPSEDPKRSPRTPLPKMKPRIKSWWMLPTALAATIAVAWMGNWTMQTARNSSVPTEAELQELQAFLEETWGIVGYGDSSLILDPWGTTAWLETQSANPL